MKKTKDYVFNVKGFPKFYSSSDLDKPIYDVFRDVETTEITAYQKSLYGISHNGKGDSYELNIGGEVADVNVDMSKSDLLVMQKLIREILKVQ